MSLFVKITFASGYAAISSGAKQAAGMSVTACVRVNTVPIDVCRRDTNLAVAQKLVEFDFAEWLAFAFKLGSHRI